MDIGRIINEKGLVYIFIKVMSLFLRGFFTRIKNLDLGNSFIPKELLIEDFGRIILNTEKAFFIWMMRQNFGDHFLKI